MKNIKNPKCWKCGVEVPKIIYSNITTIPKCDKCGALYPEKPELESKLTISQDIYLKNRTDENLNNLFLPLNQLTFNIICHHLKNTASKLPKESIDEKVQWTLEKLLTYYKTKPDFKISGSFTKYIDQVVLYPLYNKKEQERKQKEISIFSPIDKNSNDKDRTILDQLSQQSGRDIIGEIEEKIYFEKKSSQVLKESVEFIKTSINMLYKYENKRDIKHSFTKCIKLTNLYKFFILGKNDRFMTELYKSSGVDLMNKFNATKELLKKNLYKLAEE